MIRRQCLACGFSVLLPLFAAGCGGQSSNNTIGGSGSAGISAAGSGATIGESGAGGTSLGGATAAVSVGTLILEAYGGPSGKVATEATAPEPGVGIEETCAAPLSDGACQLTSCRAGGIGTPGGGFGNFGPISASVGTTTVQLTYGGFGYGTVYFPESVTLGTGDTMKFHGGNHAGIPAFDVSAIIPGLAVITSPVPTTDGSAVLIDTSQDLHITWAPIAIGQIRFHINAGTYLPNSTSVTLACTFEGASGAGVASHTLLSSLKEMSAGAATSVGLSSGLQTTTVVGGLSIETWSYQSPTSPNPDFSVTLQ